MIGVQPVHDLYRIPFRLAHGLPDRIGITQCEIRQTRIGPGGSRGRESRRRRQHRGRQRRRSAAGRLESGPKTIYLTWDSIKQDLPPIYEIKRPGGFPGRFTKTSICCCVLPLGRRSLVVHSAHARSTTPGMRSSNNWPSSFLGLSAITTFGGQHHARDRGRILQRDTGNFRRIDDTGLEQVLVYFRTSVETRNRPRLLLLFCTTMLPSIPAVDNGSGEAGSSIARLMIAIPVVSSSLAPFSFSKEFDSADISYSTTGYDAFFNGSAGWHAGRRPTRSLLFQLHFYLPVAAPIYNTATPPLSLARRSW